MARYIFICGGVMSGIGKGIATASIGRILKSRGFRVTAVKIDPYLNVDAGTMNPIEHGEVFVTKDGMECDQDVGNYERFLDEDIPKENYMTSGAVYRTVIERERRHEYGGNCVQVVPHIPLEVIDRLEKASKKARADITLVEIGGTVGEYENILFLEAARMMRLTHPKNVLFALISYLPVPEMIGEMKTKPTQHAVRAMNATGIQPDFIIGRSRAPLDDPRKKKLAVLCNVSEKDIISAPDTRMIYEVPVNFENEELGNRILEKFALRPKKRNMQEWRALVSRTERLKKTIRIGVVGKYFNTGAFVLSDSYISVIEAIKHASWAHGAKPVIEWIDAEKYEKSPRALQELKKYNGIIVPGGFGKRGVEGKIKAIEFCRKNRVPYLGLCYGLQLAVVEYARHVCGIKDAHTTEINPKTKNPVIHVLPEQLVNIKDKNMGGSMRLGDYRCFVRPGTKAAKAYGKKEIVERHRHRYEVNNDYRDLLEKKGFIFSGINPERNLVEIGELPNHPFFMGSQFHPELISRPLHPHPMFLGFIKAGLKK